MDRVIPSPYEWAGGFEAIQALFKAFYTRVPLDPVLGPVFAGMPRYDRIREWNQPKRLISQPSRLHGATSAKAPRGRQVMRPSRRACTETRGGVVLHSIHSSRDE
jgi:truncated hemoglobin YjbI